MEKSDSTNDILKKFWEKILHRQYISDKSWDQQVMTINKCGRGLQETLSYLYQNRPSFEFFFDWMMTAGADDPDALTEDVLTSEDLDFFHQNGYIVVHNAVSEEQLAATKKAIVEYLQIDLANADTWYQDHPEKKGLMVMLYQHPALNASRNSPKIKKVYQQLYGTDKIHRVIEKVSFNPPETSFHKFTGSPLHWDVSLVAPIPFKLQGLLYLNDVDENGGAFHCVPGFHNKVEQWLQSLSPGINPRDEAIKTLHPQAISGKAGDLIIWHQALPHCASPNHSKVPRFVQYITYDPDDYRSQDVWL